MSKATFKGIIIGAIIGFATGGLGAVLNPFSTAGFMAAAKAGAIMGAIGGGLSGLAQSFISKPNMDMGSVVDRQNLSIDPQALGKWVFGETPCATDIVFSQRIGDNAVAHVVAAAAHEIDSFGDFYINDELITFPNANSGGDWLNVLQKYEWLGTDPQSHQVIPGSSWDFNARGAGIAYFALRWDFSVDSDKLEGGIPTRVTQIVKGSKVYDPRLDTTKGGTGTHRVNDQSTWEWSDNWALIVAHYLVGYKNADKLVYGVGLNPDDIDWLQVATMANVCDETVDSKPRYRIGGILPTTNDHQSIIGQLEASVGGKVSKVGGKYYIWCPHNDLATQGTITNDKIVREGGVTFSPTGNISQLFNTARGRFIDPDTLYQPTPYPEIVESSAVAEDDRTRLMERDFSIIQDRSIAERVAREMVRRSRFSATWTLTMGPEGLLYQPFDVVTLNCDETDSEDQLVRIISMDFSPSGIVSMLLLEEDASIYDITLPLGTPVTQFNPDSYDPTTVIPVTGLTATPTTITGSGGTVSDAFAVSWNDPGGFVRDTEIRYRITGETNYSYVQATGFTSAIITPVESNTQYDIEARHITRDGVKSPYVAITATSNDNARSRSVNGIVEYEPSNSWLFDPVSGEVAPNQPLDAVFTFARGASPIATRTVRGVIDGSTGNITVNVNHANTGEVTNAIATGNGTRAVAIKAEHQSSGVTATAQFLANEVEQPTTVSVSYSQTNTWVWNPEDNTTRPANTVNDAVFTFKRQGSAIATRTVRATVNTADGTISVNANQATSGEATTATVIDNNTAGVLVNVEHDDSGVVGNGQFNTSEQVDLTQFINDLDQLNTDLGDLQTELDNSFPITETQIDDDAISTPKLQANSITTLKIGAGQVTAQKISVGNLAAINARTGRLTSDIIQTAPAGQRLEITGPETDPTYALWIGDGSDNEFGSISNATTTLPVVITSSSHGLTTGDEVGIRGVAGMTEINGKVYTVTVLTSNTFSLDGEDGTNYSAYISGGVWQKYAKNDTDGTVWFKHNGDAKIDGGTLTTGLIQSSNYQQGTQGFIMGLDNGAAEFSNIVARGNVIAGPATGDRVEVTTLNPPGTPRDYRIWIGDGDKNDANGVFWVDADGVAKIDGGTFNIGTRGDTATASDDTLASQTANTLTVSTGDFTSNGNAVNITGVANYFASKSTTGTCSAEYSAAPSSLGGDLRVQRSTNSGSTWANVGSLIAFSAPTNTQGFGESPDPITCFASVNLDKTFTILDTAPPSGNVRYRIIYDSFSSFFLSGQVFTNRLEITALQG